MFCTFTAAQAKPEQVAQESAEAWLALVDGGNYAGSWDQAAELFKAAVTKDQWQSALNKVRIPLGKLVLRKFKSATYAKTLPGAPDGEYVVLQYDTSFEHKQAAVETVTPMLDKDGKWRSRDTSSRKQAGEGKTRDSAYFVARKVFTTIAFGCTPTGISVSSEYSLGSSLRGLRFWITVTSPDSVPSTSR